MKRRPHARLRSCSLSSADQLEVRQLLSAVSVDPASIDGSGNNIDEPELGSAGIELLRISDPEYADGLSEPAGDDRVSAREVSNALAAQSGSVFNDRNLTDYIWIWGQFLDHDIDLTEAADPAEEFNISVPAGDVFFDPFGTGNVEIGLSRSEYSESSSDDVRQQINRITAFIDGSVVYGSDHERADALRTFSGGLLKTSDGNLLPFNEEGLENAGGPSDTLFLAGDVRANENVVLTSMHTIFVREHNRIATELAAENPDLNDEELYQQARQLVTAQLQVITYNEFLPALLGAGALSAYDGYDPSVNPGITNEFSTAAYRFGHSLLSPEIQRLDADGNVIEEGNLALQEAFFSPDEVIEHGIDSLLRGAATQLAQEVDSQVIDDVRNFLFGPPGAGGFDLAALNIQRGRDHGLADYNQVRTDLGLTPVTSFDQISSNPDVVLALEQTYDSVDDIDLWVGGLAEDHWNGGSLGETFTTIIVDQFERLRDGDRYWYQNIFSGRELAALEDTHLSDIIERNTDITGLQTNLFFARGTEVLHIDAQQSGSDNLQVQRRDDRIEIVDLDRNRLLGERPIDEVAGVEFRGADGVRERFTIDANIAGTDVAMQVTVSGGRGSGDTVVVNGTRGDDVMTVYGTTVSVEDLDVVFEDVEMLILEGGAGDDLLDATNSDAPLNMLDGGAGDDTLLGSDRSDRMFGGDGRDVLRGRGGNDHMAGGRDNDRLYGQHGMDQMNGGSGNDIVMQSGDGTSPTDQRRLAAFLQDTLQIRNTGNTFDNWGGRGERWIWSGAERQWLFITPDGNLYRWDRTAGASGELIASLGEDVFADLSQLTTQQRQLDDDNRPDTGDGVTEMLRSLSLRMTGNLFENWAGLGEIWIWGRSGWYFLTPDGALYEYDANAGATPGNLVAQLTPDFFSNPERLTSSRRRG